MSKVPYNKRSYEEVTGIIENQGYTINGDFVYDNNRSKVDISDKYGYRYLVEFRSIVRGVTQRIVSKNNPYSIDNIKLYIKINNINVELVSDCYENNKQDLEFICECGEHYFAKWDKFQQGYKRCCKKCSDDKRIKGNTYDIEYVKKYIKDNNIDVEVLSETYASIYEPLCFRCSCGEIFYRSFDKFKNGNQTRCNKCSGVKSSYCVRLENILFKNNVEFKTEVSFEDCKNPNTNTKLRFDYSISKNNKLILIEVDGEGHYLPIDFSGKHDAENQLKNRQYLDNIKTQYCKDKNIELIRIPYWDFDKNDTFIEHITHIL